MSFINALGLFAAPDASVDIAPLYLPSLDLRFGSVAAPSFGQAFGALYRDAPTVDQECGTPDDNDGRHTDRLDEWREPRVDRSSIERQDSRAESRGSPASQSSGSSTSSAYRARITELPAEDEFYPVVFTIENNKLKHDAKCNPTSDGDNDVTMDDGEGNGLTDNKSFGLFKNDTPFL